MSVLSPARALALKVTSQVRVRNSYVQNTIESVIRKAKGISKNDKAFAELLSTGVVSVWGTLDEIIDRNLNSPNDIKPDVRDALRISTYELAFLGKQDHAVVDQGVELVKSVALRASGVGNKILRRIAQDVRYFPWGDPNVDDDALARKTGFPYWMADRLIAELGRDKAVVFMLTSSDPSPMFVAINSLKSTTDQAMQRLEEIGAKPAILGPKNRGCIKIGEPAALLKSELIGDGTLLITDASAQLTALAATPPKEGYFLEIGSGRGTKTILLQSNANKTYSKQGEIYCVDIHGFKSKVLQQRLEQFGVKNIYTFEGDASNLDAIGGLPKTFKKALIDAPCSGLGTLRRHPEIRWKLEPSDITMMAGLGLEMLKSVSPRIEVGGSIVYSTCTVFKEENTDVIAAFLECEQGKNYRIQKIGEMDYVQNSLVPNGPDVHFIAVLERVC